MAKVRKNVVIQGLTGSIAKQIVIKTDKSGQTIVSAMPTFNENRQFTEAQQEQHEAFREAVAYAKSAKNEEIYEIEAAGTAKSTFNVAVADWFHAPEIKEIDISAWDGQIGQTIRVRALDDVQVQKVTIVISASDGSVLEQGEAQTTDGLWWVYITTAEASEGAIIVATAQDLPGHSGTMTVD